MKKILFTLIIPGILLCQARADDSISDFLESDSLSDELRELFEYVKFADSLTNALVFDSSETVVSIRNIAELVVPEGFVYLNEVQSAEVIHKLYGNPESIETWGILFAEGVDITSDSSYFVNITFSGDGFVSDDDASDLDYDELLIEMQSASVQSNIYRIQNGYEAIELIGWASEPFYDATTKKLHWAKEIKFGEDSIHTLNYNIRALGRGGYLEMNFVSTMPQLEVVENSIGDIVGSVSFLDGHRYADFNEDTDKTAAYGIGGLIAGGVILKSIAKVGFFAKFWKFILIGFAALAAGVKKMFGREKKES